MGHPTAIFLASPDPNYKCAICLDVFDDPVSLLRCGHTFCRSCLGESLCQSGRKCPECRAEVDLGEDDDSDYDDDESESERCNNGNVIHSVRVIQSAIGNSIVRCRNCLDENGELIVGDSSDKESGTNANDAGDNDSADNNDDNHASNDAAANSNYPPSSSSTSHCCNWTGPLSQWPIHASHHCPIAPVTCPIPGCTHKCPRSEMKSHVGSASCVKAAVVTRVEQQMNGMLSHLRTQMKKEVERQVCELKKERGVLIEKITMEQVRKLEVENVNFGLRREVKDLKKVVKRMREQQEQQLQAGAAEEQQHQQQPVLQVAAAAVAAQIGNATNASTSSARKESKKEKKKRNHSATLVSPSASMERENHNPSEENSKKRKKKKGKKRKKNRHNHGVDEQEQQERRMRAVSTDSTGDVGVRISD